MDNRSNLDHDRERGKEYYFRSKRNILLLDDEIDLPGRYFAFSPEKIRTFAFGYRLGRIDGNALYTHLRSVHAKLNSCADAANVKPRHVYSNFAQPAGDNCFIFCISPISRFNGASLPFLSPPFLAPAPCRSISGYVQFCGFAISS